MVWGKSASTWVNIRKGLHHFINDYTYNKLKHFVEIPMTTEVSVWNESTDIQKQKLYLFHINSQVFSDLQGCSTGSGAVGVKSVLTLSRLNSKSLSRSSSLVAKVANTSKKERRGTAEMSRNCSTRKRTEQGWGRHAGTAATGRRGTQSLKGKTFFLTWNTKGDVLRKFDTWVWNNMTERSFLFRVLSLTCAAVSGS